MRARQPGNVKEHHRGPRLQGEQKSRVKRRSEGRQVQVREIKWYLEDLTLSIRSIPRMAWWDTPIILALGRLKQDQQVEASLGYIHSRTVSQKTNELQGGGACL